MKVTISRWLVDVGGGEGIGDLYLSRGVASPSLYTDRYRSATSCCYLLLSAPKMKR